jgi:hypothetical protein
LREITAVDPLLTLEGLRIVWHRRSDANLQLETHSLKSETPRR